MVAPAGIVAVAGTMAALCVLLRLTTKPPVGAGPEMTSVPVDEVRPITVVGVKVRDVRVGGLMVRVPT